MSSNRTHYATEPQPLCLPVFLKETRLLTALALPMLLAQVAQVGIGFVDTVMAGGAGKEDLAAVALGSSAFSTIYITFMGVMAALNPMICPVVRRR